MGTSELLGQPYKMLRVTWSWTSIPPWGSSNTPSRLHAMETGINSGIVGQFGPKRLTFTYCNQSRKPLARLILIRCILSEKGTYLHM